MDCKGITNPKTGAASVNCGVTAGDEKVNARAGVFAETKSSGGPVRSGAFGAMNIKTEAGHSATVGVEHVPKFNMTTMNASGRANLYTSPSGNLNVEATANAMRHTSGPFRGRSDVGYGLNMQYRF